MPYKDIEKRREAQRRSNRKTRQQMLARAAQWATDFPDEPPFDVRRNRVLDRYGLDLPTYHKLLEDQGGVCAICEKKCFLHGDTMSVDHCHETGRIRGLLCHRCNTSLGGLGDSPTLVEKALTYLLNAESYE